MKAFPSNDDDPLVEESWSTSNFIDVPLEHSSQSNECPTNGNETLLNSGDDILMMTHVPREREYGPPVLVPKGFPHPSHIYSGYSNEAGQLTEKDIVAGNIIMNLQKALVADEILEAIRLFNRLKEQVGIKNLRDDGLEWLLYILAKSPFPAPFVDEVINEIKEEGNHG